jgi:hypothetical protein
MRHILSLHFCLLCECSGRLVSLAIAEAAQYKANNGDNLETGASSVSLRIQ